MPAASALVRQEVGAEGAAAGRDRDRASPLRRRALGAAKVEDLGDRRFDFENVLPAVLEFFRAEGIDRGAIPLIPAGGINHAGADPGTAGAGRVRRPAGHGVRRDGGRRCRLAFKRVLPDARPEDIVEFVSVAGLPARAVRTPWLAKYLEYLPKLAAVAHKKPRCTLKFDCLFQCGLRDGNAKVGQFCIDQKLAEGLAGDVRKGLFFRGAAALPFGSEIRPVRDLLDLSATGAMPGRPDGRELKYPPRCTRALICVNPFEGDASSLHRGSKAELGEGRQTAAKTRGRAANGLRPSDQIP